MSNRHNQTNDSDLSARDNTGHISSENTEGEDLGQNTESAGVDSNSGAHEFTKYDLACILYDSGKLDFGSVHRFRESLEGKNCARHVSDLVHRENLPLTGKGYRDVLYTDRIQRIIFEAFYNWALQSDESFTPRILVNILEKIGMVKPNES